MSAIRDIAQDLWYRSPETGRDRRRAKRISAEAFRYEQIEKALVELLKDPNSEEARKAGRKALKLSTDIDLQS